MPGHKAPHVTKWKLKAVPILFSLGKVGLWVIFLYIQKDKPVSNYLTYDRHRRTWEWSGRNSGLRIITVQLFDFAIYCLWCSTSQMESCKFFLTSNSCKLAERSVSLSKFHTSSFSTPFNIQATHKRRYGMAKK